MFMLHDWVTLSRLYPQQRLDRAIQKEIDQFGEKALDRGGAAVKVSNRVVGCGPIGNDGRLLRKRCHFSRSNRQRARAGGCHDRPHASLDGGGVRYIREHPNIAALLGLTP